MGYRTNYSLYINNKIVKQYINKACFSGFYSYPNKYNVLKLYILPVYSDIGNDLIFTVEQIKYLVKDLKNIGFRFKYLGPQPVKNYFNKYDLQVKSLYENDNEITDLIYVFEFDLKKHYYANRYALLFVLSILRYLYEKNNQETLVEYFKLRKHKSEEIRRLGIIKLLLIAHYLAKTTLFFGGHNVGIKTNSYHLVNKKEFLHNINNSTVSTQKMFLGKLRKKNILFNIENSVIEKDVMKIYNLIK